MEFLLPEFRLMQTCKRCLTILYKIGTCCKQVQLSKVSIHFENLFLYLNFSMFLSKSFFLKIVDFEFDLNFLNLPEVSYRTSIDCRFQHWTSPICLGCCWLISAECIWLMYSSWRAGAGECHSQLIPSRTIFNLIKHPT